MTTGQRIKEARKKAGLTQKGLAEKLGIAYQTLAQWENDLRNPKMETIERIAQALGVPIVQIKANITMTEYQQTEEFEHLERSALLYEGIEATLENIYGALEKKSIIGETGLEQLYCLVGKPPNTFVLYEADIDALVESAKAILPPMVERMKDTRPEHEIIAEIKTYLNSERARKSMNKAMEEHIKKFPETAAYFKPYPPPQSTLNCKDTTPPSEAAEGPQEGE